MALCLSHCCLVRATHSPNMASMCRCCRRRSLPDGIDISPSARARRLHEALLSSSSLSIFRLHFVLVSRLICLQIYRLSLVCFATLASPAIRRLSRQSSTERENINNTTEVAIAYEVVSVLASAPFDSTGLCDPGAGLADNTSPYWVVRPILLATRWRRRTSKTSLQTTCSPS